MLPDVPAGATWRRVDLHLHTPAVNTFNLPSGADPSTPGGMMALVDQYVAALRSAGIQLGAITDYQGVREEWFTAIRDRAQQEGIDILPGAELSVAEGRGLHLLIICGPDTTPAEINAAILHLDREGRPLFDGLRKPYREVHLRDTLENALLEVRRKLRCVVVSPHASDGKGVFTTLKAERVASLVSSGLLDAIDKCEDARAKLTSTGRLTREQVKSVACTLSSDPKRMEDIGATMLPDGRPRATWIKLSVSSADALRLALHDPETRVLTREPEPVDHPRILSMEADHGFLREVAIRFSDDLTALIGGRGAGKSAILETLRYALGGEPFAEQTERLSLVRHALGSGGRVRLVIERPGPQRAQQYEVTRVLDQQPRVTDLNTGAALEVPPLEIFGAGRAPVILLQREIQAVARDDGFRRRILDEIVGEEARQADTQARRTIDELRRNHRAIEDAERQLAQREDYEERLHKLRAEIAFFEQQGVSEKLDRHSRAGADLARLQTASRRADEAADSHGEAASTVDDALGAAAAELRAAASDYAGLLTELAAETDAVRSRVSDAHAIVTRSIESLQDKYATALAEWPARISALLGELQRIREGLGSDTLDPERYVEMVGERTALEPIVKDMARHEAERRAMLETRRRLLRRLQDERREAFALRQRVAEAVNRQLNGKLHVDVAYLGDTEDFGRRLTSLLRGSRVSADAIDAIATSAGTDGVELAKIIGGGEPELRARFNLTEATSHRLARWFTDEPSRLRQIEILAPADRVSIALVTDGVARDLSVLSSGQKATAMLLLLFAQGGRPLVLDQPEDDLDNRFVYEDVVGMLRAEKGVADPRQRRQIIAATHNANIPVNGDAELVLSLADEDGRCDIRTRASIDDATVRGEIRTVLEGGAEAFRRRAEKYGGLDDT